MLVKVFVNANTDDVITNELSHVAGRSHRCSNRCVQQREWGINNGKQQ